MLTNTLAFVAISTPREAAKDVVICGQFLPKGTIVEIVPAMLAYNPTVWGPTVDRFDPDRFANLPREAQDPYVHQSFISGPRVCIGKSFALLEFRALLVHLVRNFEFESDGRVVEYLRGSPSLRPAGGLHLRIIRI
jgi:cytochrome P450